MGATISEKDERVLEWFSNDIIQSFKDITVSEQIHHDRKIFQPVRPPYMIFPDQSDARKALIEAYSDGSFLLLHGYAGAGKSTILQQMAIKNPENVFYFAQCSQTSPSALLGKIAEKFGLSIKQRYTEKDPVEDALKNSGRKILIFDDVVLDNDILNFQRINMITSLYESTGQPVVICGTNALYHRLYDDRWIDKYDHIRSRLIRQEMKGMSSKDAYDYLQMMQDEENICFTMNARQALVKIATEPKYAGIRKFTMVIGRIASKARAEYYTSGGRTIPDNAKCIEQIMAPGKNESVPAFIYILPKTPDMLSISEEIVLEEIVKCVGSIPKNAGRKKRKRREASRETVHETAHDAVADNSPAVNDAE